MSSHREDEPPSLTHPDEIDQVFGRGNPNPDRVGCPPQDTLIALSRRQRPIEDPAYGHLSKCSPCYVEVRARQQSDAARRRRALTWAAAAAALFVVGTTVTWLFMARGGGSHEPRPTEVRMELDLRPYALMRSAPPPSDRKALLLPRGRVILTMLLPVGSEPGLYEVQVLDAQQASKASGGGNAVLENQVTRLETRLELRSLPPGLYQLAVRRTGEGWQLFPLQVE
jgi:hypothetical protein